jgi:6-phosphogluconolactonase (cycloisomerase 2 family)
LDDNQVVYPAGHNIVIYHIEDKTQKAFPCIEGTEGITAMAISKNRRTLAVAEKSDKTPICTIYRVDDDRSGNEERKTDAKTLRKRKIICSTEITKHKSFVSMAFCPKNDKLLATLSSEPEQSIYIW